MDGPLAGLAAGIGLAALASHFGFGEELANFMMMALLAMVVIGVIGSSCARRLPPKATRACSTPVPERLRWQCAAA